MNISKHEQRVLHELALGGEIKFMRADNRKVKSVQCFTRDGFAFPACTLDVFTRLKDKRFIKSLQGGSYRITKLGNTSVRAQMNQR
ncbi:YjhX family toxin [Paracoccus indicus]|uniref:YjhX family toxin n=1 Tax=Paracoccus indicus TaxID=2079229 RepID=UPI000D36901F|nr:YjhX family toxin [Paracoccus indicus]